MDARNCLHTNRKCCNTSHHIYQEHGKTEATATGMIPESHALQGLFTELVHDHFDRDVGLRDAEVQDYIAMDEGGSDLRAMVKLIDDYGPDALISAIDRLVDEPSDAGNKPMALTTAKPDVIVSTAHKAKGREWASVLIGEDFYPPKIDETGEQKEADPGELRLAYVAVTRARLVLDRGSLRWLDAYRRQLPIPAPELIADDRTPVSAAPAPQNASSTAQEPAQPLPAGIYCAPAGRIAPEDLDDLTKAEVQTFADYLRQRKELGDHYSQLLAAAAPGTREYTRIADERATKLRQLAATPEPPR